MSVQEQIDQLDLSDPNFLEKLNALALKHAQSQGKKVQTAIQNIVDPSDMFACDSCQ